MIYAWAREDASLSGAGIPCPTHILDLLDPSVYQSSTIPVYTYHVWIMYELEIETGISNVLKCGLSSELHNRSSPYEMCTLKNTGVCQLHCKILTEEGKLKARHVARSYERSMCQLPHKSRVFACTWCISYHQNVQRGFSASVLTWSATDIAIGPTPALGVTKSRSSFLSVWPSSPFPASTLSSLSARCLSGLVVLVRWRMYA